MKIKTKILTQFLKEIRMGDVDTCLLKFEEDGLKILVGDKEQHSMAEGILFKKSFDEYSTLGNVGVDDLGTLIRVFGRLGQELEFDVKGNVLIAKGKKKELEFELVDEKFISPMDPMPTLEHATSFKLTGDVLKDFLDDVSLTKDSVITFESVNDGVKISNSGKYKFTYNIDSEGTKAGESAKFGTPLVRMLGEVKEGNLLFHLKTNFPLLIDRETEQYKIRFLTAPRVDN